MRIGLSLKLSEPKYNVLAQNIRALFADGSQGWWYDDNDTTTLFQDSAGTTPVTAVEQFVGLQLDKSLGLVLGPELVPSPISSVSGAGWSTNGTSITATNSTASGAIVLTATTSTAKFYAVTFTASNLSGATSYMAFSSGISALTKRINTAKTYSFIVPGQGNTVFQIVPYEGTAFSVTISNISVRELPGNHRYAPASGNRPIWSKRVNLLTKTEQFDDAVWTKGRTTVSANAGVAPDGTTTADKIIATSASGSHYVSQGGVQNAVAVRVLAKAAEYNVLQIAAGISANQFANFDLAGGVLGSVGSEATNASITAVGNGWYLCQCSFTATNSLGAIFAIAPLTTSTWLTAFVGNDVSGIYIWGADLRPANQATGLLPLYQRVNTSSDYDTNGFPGYLKADGVDDFLQTNSINFTATDKITLCAGVRKLSDAAQAVVTELSASIASNNGTFLLAAPDGATNTYGWDSKGTTQVDAVASSRVAPLTNVVTGIGNISGDSAIIRVNSVVADTETGDQGTGNYGNYPAYFFQRNSPAGLRFNGNEYGNVAVGKLLTADQLTALETYMNGLTKAY